MNRIQALEWIGVNWLSLGLFVLAMCAVTAVVFAGAFRSLRRVRSSVAAFEKMLEVRRTQRKQTLPSGGE